MTPNLEIPRNEITEPKHLEGTEKIPMRVNDLRNSMEGGFDLDKFLSMISRLRSEGLYAISREFKDSDYGKYMSVAASSESDHWDDVQLQKTSGSENAQDFSLSIKPKELE